MREGAEGAAPRAAIPLCPMPHELRSRVRRLGHGNAHSARTPATTRNGSDGHSTEARAGGAMCAHLPYLARGGNGWHDLGLEERQQWA